MKTRFNKRVSLFIFGLLVCLVLTCFLWVYLQQHQYVINRQLITALDKSDIKQALALVEAGADPNTHYKASPTLVPSFPALVDQLLHRSPPPINDSPTAFMMACAAGWREGQGPFKRIKFSDSDPQQMQLRHTMVLHGANINAKDDGGWTALHWAVSSQKPGIIKQLLEYGADPYAHNPNSDEGDGESPFRMAEETRRPDIIALFHKATGDHKSR